jgi:hypothetical protein
MKGQPLRRVLAVVASVALVLAFAGPAVALNQVPGTISCPTRPSGIHAVFINDIEVYAPGDVYHWDTSTTWAGRNYAGAIGGGSYDLYGTFNLAQSYVYCQ